jgi:hypothetical protein
MYFHECVAERGVRTGQRWVWRIARVWRSLDVDQRADVEPAERGQHDNNDEENYRVGRSGEVLRRGDLQDQPPTESPERRFE